MEREQVIRDLSFVDLSLREEHIDLLSFVFKKDMRAPATDAEIARAQNWIGSRGKRIMEQKLSGVARLIFGRLVDSMARSVAAYDGNDGYFYQARGFLGYPEDQLIPHKKVRTMEVDADSRRTIFQHSAFTRVYSFLEGNNHDDRILPLRWVRLARRIGLDELPQLIEQVAGPRPQLDLIGNRAYSKPEIAGTQLLIAYRDDPELNLDPKVRTLLASYGEKMHVYARQGTARCGIFGPKSATLGKLSPFPFSLYCDISYMEKTDPYVDFRLFVLPLLIRPLGIGGG